MAVRQVLGGMMVMVGLVLGVMAPAAVQAQSAYGGPGMAQASTEPLAIVRFNQARVYYQRPLYQAVSRAVQVKPSVLFDVVAISPKVKDSNVNARLQKQTQARGQEIVSALQGMGVPADRIHLLMKESAAIPTSEVHVFVK